MRQDGMVTGAATASSMLRGGEGGVMPPQEGGGATPLGATGGVMPSGASNGSVTLPRENDGEMPFQEDGGEMLLRRCTAARGRHEDHCEASRRWCDAIVVMELSSVV